MFQFAMTLTHPERLHNYNQIFGPIFMTTKKDLIKSLHKNLAFLKAEDTSYAVDLVIDYLKQSLIDDYRIEIRGFGSLSKRKRKYAGKSEVYHTIYYRMSRSLAENLND
jgi:integration host factor subunit beta